MNKSPMIYYKLINVKICFIDLWLIIDPYRLIELISDNIKVKMALPFKCQLMRSAFAK